MPYIPPEYPTDVPSAADLPNRVDDVDWISAARYNEIKKELRAVLTELGTLPKGAHADVKTRLDVQKKKIVDADGDTSWDTEQAADEDKIRGKVKGVESFLLNDNGILDLAKQSRVRAYLPTSVQTIGTGAWVKVAFSEEIYDNQGEFDKTSNYRFTATKAGSYSAVGVAYWVNPTDSIRYSIVFRVNNTVTARADDEDFSGAYCTQRIVDTFVLSANDYVEVWVRQESGGNVDIYQGSMYTWFSIHKLA